MVLEEKERSACDVSVDGRQLEYVSSLNNMGLCWMNLVQMEQNAVGR